MGNIKKPKTKQILFTSLSYLSFNPLKEKEVIVLEYENHITIEKK